MIFNKLVRDNIPNIIKNNGEEAIIRILDDNEYKHKLDEKLLEEVNEYLEDDNIEEIADILEVIEAILKYKKVSQDDLKIVKETKKNKKGSFDKQIFLIETK
ncbi:MAG: nucleoside triphosphate pyrophosphohydrolase [Bacilli bacterium]|nr:nucleoside triphosphate pyrophosphohydrolase [Bacilli bacterium]